MGKVKLPLLSLLLTIYFSSVCFAVPCYKPSNHSGVISDSLSNDRRCWVIDVPEDSYVRLDLKEMSLSGLSCTTTYIMLEVTGTNEEFKFCHTDSIRKPVIALNDVNITFAHGHPSYRGSFKLQYNIENLICVQKHHFRCSNHSCIHQTQVCDGLKDCENGADEIGCETGVAAVKGLSLSREKAISWLKKQRFVSSGWGRNTHRAITALYLAGNASFNDDSFEEDLFAKQVELQTSVALLRDSSEPLSVSDLSMFINALTVTCHNPRQFFGYDLIQIMNDRMAVAKSPTPAAYLTLCNANWTLSDLHARTLLKILHKKSEYPFHSDVQAVAVMALACMKTKTKILESVQNATKLYNTTIAQLIASQLPDGSFGNVYTTALVTQALISSGQETNSLWRLNSTVRFLMQELNSSADFLSTYLTLPIFNAKSLVDIGKVNCKNSRKHDDEVSDILKKLGGKMHIQYSLHVGDLKDVIHTMYLRMPENSSAYDVMRMAQMADAKYKFLQRDVSGHTYVYAIAGITNDPEAGKFWLLYTESPKTNNQSSLVKHSKESPDKLILHDGEHLIMWYKTAHFGDD